MGNVWSIAVACKSYGVPATGKGMRLRRTEAVRFVKQAGRFHRGIIQSHGCGNGRSRGLGERGIGSIRTVCLPAERIGMNAYVKGILNVSYRSVRPDVHIVFCHDIDGESLAAQKIPHCIGLS